MFVAYNVDVPMERLPFANWGLILATVVLTIYGWLNDFRQIQYQGDPQTLAKQFDPRQSPRGEPRMPTWSLERDHPRPAQFVSYAFAHGDIGHLIGNMLFLFVFGNAVNAKLGHLLFLALYCILGAFAGLCWLLIGNGQALVGAAGAIMGLCGLFLVFFPQNEVRTLFLFQGIHWFDIPSMWFVLLGMAFDLAGTVFYGDRSGIAYVCHLGGELLGVALGMGLVLSGFITSERYELNLLQVVGLQPRPGERKSKRRRKKV